MSFLRSRRGLLLAVIALVLGLFLIRPGAGRLRSRIAGSISSAVGREVEIGSVSVHLLPQPGFDLGNFVVYDNPAFSAEPMLRSDDVTAALRVSSLFRGRLEIARLNLTEPSVNLVRNGNGHWNLEDLLERANRTPVAPTSKTTGEAGPSFPYIEVDRGRINFKFGPEKKPYALTDADFNFWQDSENAWGMRLKAQPVRTDSNLSDTGLLRMNGIWQRAGSLRQTPVQFTMSWEGGQLGQLTKLVMGNDKGWRGGVTLAATFSGTPADLGVHTEASVEDFHRYDVLGGGSLRLAAKCDGRYHSADRQFSDLVCHSPSGNGSFTLNGTASAAVGAADYRLALSAQDIPAESLAAFLRHTKRDVPDDLAATGKLNAIVQLERGPNGFSWSGAGQSIGLRLESKLADTTLALDSIPFTFASAGSPESTSAEAQRRKQIARLASPDNRVEVGPFELPLGKSNAALVQGWVARSGYELRIVGDAQVQRVLQVAHMLGVPAPRPAADGSAKLDLQVAGSWTGFAAPLVTGKAQLQAVHAEVRGMNAPLDIASASVILATDQVTVQSLIASAGGTGWRGSLMIPRLCGVPGACLVRFDLHADEIATDRLNQLLNPHVLKRPWYRFLSTDSAAGAPFFLRVHASGKLSADRVMIRNLLATRVSASLALENGRLTASDLHADVLGGRHVGNWKADFVARPPEYSGSGKLEHFTLDELSDAMHDDWITGTATASYQAKIAGLSASDLFSSAEATLQVEARDGFLPHIELSEQSGPLHLRHLGAKLVLHDSTFEIQDGKLETPTGIFQLSGTASLGQILDLKLARSGAPGFTITGTVTKPRVAPSTIQETEAVLKP